METYNPSYLPQMMQSEQGTLPEAPANLAATGLDISVLLDLALKIANVNSHISTNSVADIMMLPRTLTSELLEKLRTDALLETQGQDAAFGLRYTISKRGRETAARLLETNGYIGPAPVAFESYKAMLYWQNEQAPQVTREHVQNALAELVLPEEVVHTTGLAVSSGRSLFLSGPPGNGKTTIGRKLHNALTGDIWIPHCIAVENTIIRIFDSYCHEPVEYTTPRLRTVDRRWIKIKRPFIVAGGEMTLASLDLSYLPSLKYYEAPLHVKANGGTFLIDDFGRQLVSPDILLNRWIIPLEHQMDFLTLNTGQKIQVPFLLRLIIATNLDTDRVTDPAFLRRLGYRTFIQPPSEAQYKDIFTRYAAQYSLETPPEVLEHVLTRYRSTGREMRACEPRDLIERIRDICAHTVQEPRITPQMFDMAWMGYFGRD
ncbi:MAG TPA: hypothetical protein VFT64_06815 [Rickettsiales bacterium]|nr:hypothetical protein [Rickettsiales bacterium]